MAQEQDVVLIHVEDTPATFARIEFITPDHKKGWYQIKLLLFQIPLQTVTWILRDAYINGQEFTMGGNRMRLERVICPEDAPADKNQPEDPSPPPEPDTESQTAKVISLKDRKS